MNRKNIILLDMPVEQDWGLLRGLTDETGEQWHICYKEGRLSVSKWHRIINYIIFPLTLMRLKVKNVIAWQQFYGFMFLLYSQLFKLNKKAHTIILTFIYKERKGVIGDVYRYFITNMLKNPRLKDIVVYSQNELSYYSLLFPQVKHKFKFLHLGISDISTGLKVDEKLQKEHYIFTSGASNRDYDFLLAAIADTNFKLKIACDGLDVKKNSNVEVLHNIHGTDMYQYLYNCKLVVIPLKNLEISSGQLMLLQAMQLGKPVIVSNNKGIYDYITSGYNGFIIENDKNEWISRIKDLYSNEQLYNEIAKHEIDTFNSHFSIYNLGKNLGKELKKYEF